MAHKLTWYVNDEVLYLALEGNLPPEEMKEINEQMLAQLETTSRKVTLLLDASALAVGYSTIDSLRLTQKYRDHHRLGTIVGIANNKLNRLITLLAFNLSRANFIQFDSDDKVQAYMSQRGWSLPLN